MAGERRLLGWALGVGVTLLATLVNFEEAECLVAMFYLPGIMLAAFFGGWRPGVVITVLSVASSSIVAADTTTTAATARIGLLLSIGLIQCATFAALHRAGRHARKSSEAAQADETRLALLFDASPIAKAISRVSDGRIIDVNAAYLRLFDITRDQIVGMTPHEAGLKLAPERRAELVTEIVAKCEVRDQELNLLGPDGKVRTVVVSSQCVELSGELIALTTLVDRSERVRAQEAAREAGERFRQLAEVIEDVFWLTDLAKQEMIYISPAYARVWGRDPQALYGSPRDWVEAIHPDDRERVLADALSKQTTGAFNERYRIIRPDGSVRWIQDRAFPVFDETGKVVRVAGVARDITEQLRLQDSLHQTQKLESLGLLAGGVAHDFNNILCVITNNTELLGETLPRSSPDYELVREIDVAAQRAASLTKQLLAFGRKQVVCPTVIDLNQTVAEVGRLFGRMVTEDISFLTTRSARSAHVLVDQGQMLQVLMNLCVNARDAIGPGGRIDVLTRVTDGEVIVEVSDDGPGMSDEVKAHIFEPFFTTKELGRGTGLGLAVVDGIIKQAGGSIEVETSPGAGATFRIRLPVAEERTEGPSSVPERGRESILIVDDDRALRASTARVLKQKGYAVVEAASGIEALKRLRSGRRFDLLVTDVVMPAMGGRELAEAVASEFPELKILFTSGYTDDEILRRGIVQDGVHFLEKPFGGSVLAAKVRSILDGKSGRATSDRLRT